MDMGRGQTNPWLDMDMTNTKQGIWASTVGTREILLLANLHKNRGIWYSRVGLTRRLVRFLIKLGVRRLPCWYGTEFHD